MTVRYQNAPVVEAIFECFVQPRSWSEASSERLVRDFRAAYSGQKELVRNTGGFQFSISPEGQSVQQLDRGPDRVRLWKSDKSGMVQFGADMCALNALPPYGGFGSYAADLKLLCNTFFEQSQASQVTSLGQRYINRVRLPSDDNPADFFAAYPRCQWVPGSQSLHPPFAMQVQTCKLALGQVILNIAFEGIQEGKAVYLIDLYARTGEEDGKVEAAWAALESWHVEAHQKILQSFEGSLTEAAKTFLGREES